VNVDKGFNKSTTLKIDSDFDMGIYSFWKRRTSRSKNKEIIIALIDTCVDISHEDLNKNIWKNKSEIPNDGIDNDNNNYVDDYYGWNFIDNCKIVNKNINDFSHGTHCAGIIAAVHNHIGIMGIAGNENVKIMVLPAIERGEDDEEIQNVIDAIRYAENMGAQICNLSATFSKYSKNLEEAIELSNMYFVVAAGNYENSFIQGLDINETKRYPASFNFDNVITVGSLDPSGDLASSSNYGVDTVDITAPGEFIYSTLPNNTYGFISGTSMAVPMVTSVLALYYLHYNVDMAEAVNMLYQNAHNSDSLSEKIIDGRMLYFAY
jgi:subtilisin family serine protease